MTPQERTRRRACGILACASLVAWGAPLQAAPSPPPATDHGVQAVTTAHDGTTAVEAEPPQAPEPSPIRMADVLGAPTWLRLSLNQRSRYEQLWQRPVPVAEAGELSNVGALMLRTLLALELSWAPLVVGAELADARAYVLDPDTPLNPGLVNPLEPLQAYVGFDLDDAFATGHRVRLRAGRLTLDAGSRRLLARNRYRNTINAFTGLDLQWKNALGDQFRGFFTLPVERLPDQQQDLRDHRIELDREHLDQRFWGLVFVSRPWPAQLQFEAYLFGLQESDGPHTETRNRHLLTPGARLSRTAARGQLDLELEGALQVGHSRTSARPDDHTDLSHQAFFTHLELGYTFDAPAQPRVVIEYDYASGDRNPDDHHNGRFDTLFGARRFDYGPTGLYGLFARSNLQSPGLRVQLLPHARLDAFIGYRALWLAAARDAWTTTGVRDASGGAGRFLGHQLEAQVRFIAWPGNLTLEAGFAHTALGAFAHDAPNGLAKGDPSYAYLQSTVEL